MRSAVSSLPKIPSLAVALFSLSSCTTLASGIASQPPGVNRYSFRECLIDNGFFTPAPLSGIPEKDYEARRTLDHKAPTSAASIITMPDPLFVVRTGAIIREGFFPHLEYADQAAAEREGFGGDVGEGAANRPYMVVPAGGGATALAPSAQSPAAGAPVRPDLAINRYLDCYLAPVGVDEPGLPRYGDYDLEGRLLRAHILVTLLAAYGTELVTSRPSKKQAEEATRLLGHLRDAELSLRSASFVMNSDLRRYAVERSLIVPIDPPAKVAPMKKGKPATKKAVAAPAVTVDAASEAAAKAAAVKAMDATADGAMSLQVPQDRGTALPFLRWSDYATRLLRAFQIGVDIEGIDADQSLDRLSNIVAAFSSKSPVAIKSILEDALKGLGTVQKVQLYGDAMRRDASETLAAQRLSLKPGPDVTRRYAMSVRAIPTWIYDVDGETMRWQLWDAKLEQSCKLLASVAKQTPAGCVPKPESMKDALAADLPPVATAAKTDGS